MTQDSTRGPRLVILNHANHIRSIAEDQTILLTANQREALYQSADHMESLQGQITMQNRLFAIQSQAEAGGVSRKALDEIRSRLEILEGTMSRVLQANAKGIDL